MPKAMQTFLDETFARNKALYGDLRMEATGGGGDGGDGSSSGADDGGDGKDGGDNATPTPKPSDTIEYWKKRSRDNEKQAKDNAEAAKRLREIEDAQKTEEQKRADAEAKQKAETEALRLENLRLRAAGTHGVSGEDAEGVAYADLISGTDEEAVERSAQAIGRLLAAAKERDELQSSAKGRPLTGRPAANLRPGATPPGTPITPSGSGGVSEAQRRFGLKTEQTQN